MESPQTDPSDEELDDKETHSTPEEEEPNDHSDKKESPIGQSHLPLAAHGVPANP